VAWWRRDGRERRHVFFADAERFTRQVVLGARRQSATAPSVTWSSCV
jgi:hypothetical protein